MRLKGWTALPLFFTLTLLAADTSKFPAFRFYKMKAGEGIVSLVVARSTTDKQLESLIWFIRTKVQQGKFSDLGIRQPTDKRFGMLGYGSGIISIYRGERCANEEFIDTLGPCGYGEHDAASYQWGVEGDSHKDEGLVRDKDGNLRKIF